VLKLIKVFNEPITYDETFQVPNRCEAIEHEINVIHKNKIYQLMDFPIGTKPIAIKWVYKVKIHAWHHHEAQGTISCSRFLRMCK
jgi:hypothetical protein